jgi:hypothetical protein
MSAKIFLWAALATITAPAAVHAQATTRQCSSAEAAGPACLLARTEIPKLPNGKVYWHLDRYASKELADRASEPTSAVVEAFGSVWLFTIATENWRARGADHVSTIGPLPVTPASGLQLSISGRSSLLG